jgi:hypothetical protein
VTQHLPKKIKTERALQSDKRLRKIAENIGEAFWLVDASTGRIRYVNLDGIPNYYATFTVDADGRVGSWNVSVPNGSVDIKQEQKSDLDGRSRKRRMACP